MGKKKKRGGGGGGGCGQQQKPPAEECEEEAVQDHADDESRDKPAAEGKDKDKDKEKGKDNDKDKDKEKEKEKGKKAPSLPVVTAVLKVDMHCDGCAKRIRCSVRHYPGVEGVAMELDKGTMTVVGRFDAKKLRDRVASKTRKKVDLVANNHKGNEDKAGSKQGFLVHEYGKPDCMYDYACLEKAYGYVAKPPPEKLHDCGGGKPEKAHDKGAKEEKAHEKGGKENKNKQDDHHKEEKGKDDKGGGKDNKKPVVPVPGTVVLKIGGMGLHCEGCMKRVRCNLFKIKGVEQVSMDMAKNQVTVTGTMDIKVLPRKLQKKVRRPVDVVPPSNKDKDGKEKDGKDKDNDAKQEGCKDKKDKDAATKALAAEKEMWKTAFYDQQSLINAEFMLSDENPNACSLM